jgi:hypothetical protein
MATPLTFEEPEGVFRGGAPSRQSLPRAASIRRARRLGALACALVVVLFSQVARAGDPIRPDPRLTPGAVLTTDTAIVCQHGYSASVRHTSGRMKAAIYREYGIVHGGGHYEIDHLIPLSIGGADVAANLWPQSHDMQPWNADVKDRLELRLLHLVCHGDVPIAEAQHDIAADWIAAYQKYCATARDCPSYAATHRGAAD